MNNTIFHEQFLPDQLVKKVNEGTFSLWEKNDYGESVFHSFIWYAFYFNINFSEFIENRNRDTFLHNIPEGFFDLENQNDLHMQLFYRLVLKLIKNKQFNFNAINTNGDTILHQKEFFYFTVKTNLLDMLIDSKMFNVNMRNRQGHSIFTNRPEFTTFEPESTKRYYYPDEPQYYYRNLANFLLNVKKENLKFIKIYSSFKDFDYAENKMEFLENYPKTKGAYFDLTQLQYLIDCRFDVGPLLFKKFYFSEENYRYLLSIGFDINYTDNYGRTVFYYYYLPELFKENIDKIDILHTDKFNRTVFHTDYRYYDPETMPKEILSMRDKHGMTILHNINIFDLKAFCRIMETGNFDINSVDKSNRTIVHTFFVTQQKRDQNFLILCLEYGIDITIKATDTGNMVAVYYKNINSKSLKENKKLIIAQKFVKQAPRLKKMINILYNIK